MLFFPAFRTLKRWRKFEMIVLNHITGFKADGVVIVPPFQAGHLGFIPRRSVEVYMLREHRNPPANCEVVISPYPLERRNGELLRLTCVLREEKGVVQRLLRALAVLRINVVAQESCTFHHQKYHYVSLIVDLSTNPELTNRLQCKLETEDLYRKESALAPLHQDRYVELFEAIIAFCGDVLVWNDGLDRRLPRMSIRPLDPDDPAPLHVNTTIERWVKGVHKGRRGIVLNLGTTLYNSIRTALGTDREVLPYILVSETEYRKLRLLFPTPEQADRMLHVGFYHNNVPGALNSILGALSLNNFNIFTSLNRSIDPNNGIWEAVIEYHGKGFPDPNLGILDKYDWLATRMVKGLDTNAFEDLKSKNVIIRKPFYPKNQNDVEESASFPIANYGPPKKTRHFTAVAPPSDDEDAQILEALQGGIDRLESARSGAAKSNAPLDLLKRIKRRRSNKIRLFLSYPSSAKELAVKVKRGIAGAFGEQVELDEFQDPNAQYVTDTIVAKIRECTGFIGIWNPEVDPSRAGLSTWMPFEFGVAYMASKEWIIVRSENVPEHVWKRITPNYSMVHYTDATFEEKVIPNVVSWCITKFGLTLSKAPEPTSS